MGVLFFGLFLGPWFKDFIAWGFFFFLFKGFYCLVFGLRVFIAWIFGLRFYCLGFWFKVLLLGFLV